MPGPVGSVRCRLSFSMASVTPRSIRATVTPSRRRRCRGCRSAQASYPVVFQAGTLTAERCMSMTTGRRWSSIGWFRAGDMPGSAAVRPGPSLTRADLMQRAKCCGSSWTIPCRYSYRSAVETDSPAALPVMPLPGHTLLSASASFADADKDVVGAPSRTMTWEAGGDGSLPSESGIRCRSRPSPAGGGSGRRSAGHP
jgi:hypothetical protein